MAWESRVRRWNFVGDAAHKVLVTALVGPTLVRPRLLQHLAGLACGMNQQEVDAKLLEMLSFLKDGREDSVETWVGSGFTHQAAANMATSYALISAMRIGK